MGRRPVRRSAALRCLARPGCLASFALVAAGCGQRVGLPTPPRIEQNATNAFVLEGAWPGFGGATDLVLTRRSFSERLIVVSDSATVAAYYPGSAAGLPSLKVVSEVAFVADSLSRPVHAAEGPDGTIYVADLGAVESESRVMHFSADGTTVLGAYRNPTEGVRTIEWRTMEGIAVDAAGNVYVAGLVDSIYRNPTGTPIDSSLARQVLRYSADGTTTAVWAEKGSAASPSAAAHPAGLYFDGSGLLVADSGDPEVPSRILKLSVADPRTSFVGFGPPDGFIQSVAAPAPIAALDVVADGEGNIYATDPSTKRALRFTPDGSTLLHLVNDPNLLQPGQAAPEAPAAIAASIHRDLRSNLPTIRVFVVDPPTGRILRYGFVP